MFIGGSFVAFCFMCCFFVFFVYPCFKKKRNKKKKNHDQNNIIGVTTEGQQELENIEIFDENNPENQGKE